MLAILSGRHARRFSSRASEAAVPASGERSLDHQRAFPDQLTTPRSLAEENARQSRQRRRYRSRNCRTFRQLGPYFQFTSPETDAQEARRRQQRLDTHRRVEELLEQRDLAASRRFNARVYAVSHATETARRFYELFMHGFDPVNRPDQSNRAEAFLRAAMLDDVLCTEFSGVDMFLVQYRMGTENHTSMALELNRLTLLDNSSDNSIQIKAEATARFRISRVTLERLFPSLIQDEAITQQLIGREYEIQYDKVFHFGLSHGRIFQHESRIDLCSGLLDMVGDPFLALRLVEASSMTRHGHWRIDEVAEDRHVLPNALL